MELDPQMKAVLEWAANAGGKPFSQSTPAEARAGLVKLLGALGGDPEPVAKIEDRKVPGPRGDIAIRIYTPAGAGPFGVTVFYHGGGWVIGNIETHDVLCRKLANGAGCVVVSVDYRLAPEDKFPAGPEDCYAATKWVAENAKTLNADANRIAVAGDSAGGNLAAVIPLMARDRGAPKIKFQLLIYPATDAADDTPSQREFGKDGYILSRADMEWFWGYYLNHPADKTNPYASPIKAQSLAGLPQALVITAAFDPLRDEGEAYAERLRQAGVTVKLSRYDGVCHGFVSMSGKLDAARRAVAECTTALRAAIGK